MARTVYDKLRALQDVLSKKFEVEKEIQEIPKSLATKTELLNRLKKSFMDKSATYQAATGARRRTSGRSSPKPSRAARSPKARWTSSRRSANTRPWTRRSRTPRRRSSSLRKELQREQASVEELKNALDKEEMMIRKQEEDVKEEQSKIKLKIKEKNAELKKLQGDEKKITPGLDEDILFKFERIIKSKSGLGIVSLTKGVCTGLLHDPARRSSSTPSGWASASSSARTAAASSSTRRTRRGKPRDRGSRGRGGRRGRGRGGGGRGAGGRGRRNIRGQEAVVGSLAADDSRSHIISGCADDVRGQIRSPLARGTARRRAGRKVRAPESRTPG